MKKLSIFIASLVLFTSISVAASFQAKQEAKAKTEKKSDKKTDKKAVKKVPVRKTVTQKSSAPNTTTSK
jgi:hypothetical protein